MDASGLDAPGGEVRQLAAVQAVFLFFTLRAGPQSEPPGFNWVAARNQGESCILENWAQRKRAPPIAQSAVGEWVDFIAAN